MIKMNNTEKERGCGISAHLNADMSDAFAKAYEKASSYGREGIGTLSEKLLHRMLKFYVEPDHEKHEIPVLGSVADVLRDGEIVEIQTHSFEKLIPKLKRFLPKYRLTVVHPLVESLYISYVDEESGELLKRRKSPKSDVVNRAACELYKIAEFIPDPNLSIRLLFLTFEDVRYKRDKKAWQKPSENIVERIPLSVTREITLSSPEDYRVFLPCSLSSTFFAKDIERLTGLDSRRAHNTLTLLSALGIVERGEKEGRAYLYKIKE